MDDPLREELLTKIGKPMGLSGPSVAPDPVNVPMIRHWVDALDDRNPAYDDATAATTRFGGLVAPPAMLQTWTMGRPTIEGIRERGGSAGEVGAESPLTILAAAGYAGTLATNSVLTFDRYLRVGDVLSSDTALASVSEQKHTGLGRGYFIAWSNNFYDASGASVGNQLFTVFKFAPGPPPESREGGQAKRPVDPRTGEELPPFDLDVTATVIVAGAIASRDFMPVHHDRDYAVAQGAPDIFMNILTSNGYVSRYVTDWSGGHSQVREISTRLGAPAIPGKPLRFRGQVAQETVVDDERSVKVLVRADSDLGNHLTATVKVSIKESQE
ncbi:MAG TPA: MaoC family dehydratase N-terminal domain-containing protein [Mycobacteriales bacterium]|nr:MaoC family dehydratase N-terminal domain-containing protein [Mycobacteriales bacterium]